MYADKMTNSMTVAISETQRRREIQQAFNEKHGITPRTIQKRIPDVVQATYAAEDSGDYNPVPQQKLSKKERLATIERVEQEMKEAAKGLNFERAAELRDMLLELKAEG